jgi:hypothetical protein
MKRWLKVLFVTLLFGLPTIPLGRVLWPDPLATTSGMAANGPTPPQLAMLIGVSLFEAAAFGLGVAFLLFGLPVVRRATGGNAPLTWATCAAIAWSLLSWWPHDNLHRVTSDVGSLISIEYTFHATLISGAALIAFTFLRLVARAETAGGPVATAVRPLPGSTVGAIRNN